MSGGIAVVRAIIAGALGRRGCFGGGVGPKDDGEMVGVEVGLEEVGGDVGAGVGSDVVG